MPMPWRAGGPFGGVTPLSWPGGRWQATVSGPLCAGHWPFPDCLERPRVPGAAGAGPSGTHAGHLVEASAQDGARPPAVSEAQAAGVARSPMPGWRGSAFSIVLSNRNGAVYPGWVDTGVVWPAAARRRPIAASGRARRRSFLHVRSTASSASCAWARGACSSRRSAPSDEAEVAAS